MTRFLGLATRQLLSELVTAILALLLMGLSVSAQAHGRIIPKDWDTPARQMNFYGGNTGSEYPEGNGEIYQQYVGTVFVISVKGSGYGVPEDAQRRMVAWGNSNFGPSTTACRTDATIAPGPCELSRGDSWGSVTCLINLSVTILGQFSKGDRCETEWGTYPKVFESTSKLTTFKNCDNIPGIAARFDPGSRQCVCRPGHVYDPSKPACVQARDRFFLIPCDSCYGNPVMPGIGAKTQSVEAGWQPWLPLRLTYNSSRRLPHDTGVDPFVQSDPSSFGEWTASFDRALFVAPQPNGRILINAARGNGLWTSFTGAPGSYLPINGAIGDRLSADASGFIYKDAKANLLEVYSADGQLLKVARIDGASLTLARSVGEDYPNIRDVGLPKSLTDQFGRIWRLEYMGEDLKSRVRAIVDPGNGRVEIAYTPADQIGTLVWNDGHARTFLYERSDLPWALTGYTDESETRAGTYTYDAAGRATGTERAGGVDAYRFSWSEPSRWVVTQTYDSVNSTNWRDHTLVPAQGLVVQLPNGQTESLTSTGTFGAVKWATKTQTAGAGSPAATSRRVFDANQNVTQLDDFNGNRSCTSYDMSRNVETARIEGLTTSTECATAWSALPAGARKTSTQSHPDWPMATRTAEPNRITTLVYNGQPDPFNGNAVASCAPADALLPDGKPIVVLCKRVEQATTDASGAQGFSATSQSGVAARVWTWTYNAVGQVLTEKDPRGTTTTANVYYADTTADHTKGDLQSSTNAAGHTTSFPRYNAYGQVLEMIDANSISSVYTYDARQRVTTVTRGGKLTSYEYWPTGLLKQVTQPDASYVAYEYDGAHRLIAVSDNDGNRITYTLDNSGNRTKENVKDPTGALKRMVSRNYDALGREQQTTGRE